MPRNEPGPQVWGGIECSHIRIGAGLRDQLAESGHLTREDDLDRIAALGLRVLRYPVLWAQVERQGRRDFRWADARLARMRALGIAPILGFLHHGSGPGDVTPLDAGFAERLADYAGDVAARYPWVRRYTPINEPVTTARFSCLYGIWHPHRRDGDSFLHLVFHSARATALAMARIREVVPDAQLVQTEDFGRVFSTPLLAYQARHENLRRFLFCDLLTGRVRRGHPFHAALRRAGIPASELAAMADTPCPPDIIGIDHYLTSDRFLDEDASRHPHVRAGGNGRHSYVDVAAVHVPDLDGQCSVLGRIREVHRRYGLPIALTEVHNGSTREEQIRWLHEAWQAARQARAEGVDLRAVTVWSLLGTTDWNSLLVTKAGHYECGAFDVRADPPRLTALGAVVAGLARQGVLRHPVLDRNGWWRREAGAGEAVALFEIEAVAKGAQAAAEALREACSQRRLTLGPTPLLGRLRVALGGGMGGAGVGPGVVLTCLRDGAAPLEVAAPPLLDAAADAFLDLVLDGETGQLRLADLGRYGQYRVMREAGIMPQRVARAVGAVGAVARG